MRLPDEVQRSVVYLGHRISDSSATKFVPAGTGFLVEVPSQRLSGFSVVYLVTAWHVAKSLEPDFDIRITLKDGSSKFVEMRGHRWVRHPEGERIDVCVLPWSPPPEADHLVIPQHIFVDEPRMSEKGIGVGDEVYVTGLFSPVIGTARNLPIVRAGHLAMIPSEEIPLKNWVSPTIPAYLIEMRSLGGLSGSPVFVQRSIKVQRIEESGREPLAAGAIFFLGLVHGHWDVSKTDLDFASTRPDKDHHEMLNAGVAIVIPAAKVKEALEQVALSGIVREAEEAAFAHSEKLLFGGSPAEVTPGGIRILRAAVSGALSETASATSLVENQIYLCENPGTGNAQSSTDEKLRHEEDSAHPPAPQPARKT
jgi:hypothetical protein